MTVRLYRSTDANAPQLGTTNDGSLFTILRACLVDGYGTRTAAGWTMPFSDIPNSTGAFKGQTGTAYFYIEDDHDYRWAVVRGYGDMTNLTTGTEKFPDDITIPSGQEYRIYKRNDTGDQYDHWVLIASEEWFYFCNLQDSNNPTGVSGGFFGQYDCANAAYTHNYLLTGVEQGSTSTSVTSSEQALFGESGVWYFKRGYMDLLKSEECKNEYDATDFANPNPFNGALEWERIRLRTNITPYVRMGQLPNLYRLMGNDNQGVRGGELMVKDLRKFVLLAEASSVYAIEYDEDVG